MARAETGFNTKELVVRGAIVTLGAVVGWQSPPPLVEAFFSHSTVPEGVIKNVIIGLQIFGSGTLGALGLDVGRFVYRKPEDLVKSKGTERFSWRKFVEIGVLVSGVSAATIVLGELIAPSYFLNSEYSLHEAAMSIVGLSILTGIGAAVIGGARGEGA